MKIASFMVVSLFLITACAKPKTNPRYTLCGTVLNTSGKPFSNVFLQLYGPAESQRDFSSYPYIPLKPDSDGRFEFYRFLPGGTYWIAVCPRPTNGTVCTNRVKKVVLSGPSLTKAECDMTITLTSNEHGLVQ